MVCMMSTLSSSFFLFSPSSSSLIMLELRLGGVFTWIEMLVMLYLSSWLWVEMLVDEMFSWGGVGTTGGAGTTGGVDTVGSSLFMLLSRSSRISSSLLRDSYSVCTTGAVYC